MIHVNLNLGRMCFMNNLKQAAVSGLDPIVGLVPSPESLPIATTHIMQPADVSLFKPFKTFWRDEVLQFQRENHNNVVRRRHVPPLSNR